MVAIVNSIEISRRPEDVFEYVTDFSHYPEWQGGIVSLRLEDDAPLAVGSRAVITRRVGARELPSIDEITELSPPRRFAVRTGEGGPITGIARGTIEPLGGGQRSRLTIALQFKGRGIGRLLVPLVVHRQARRQLPRNQETLKELLEGGREVARL